MDVKIARLKELLGHLEEVYVGDDGAVAFPSPDASDEGSVMWDPWLNGSGLVVPTPGLEPGSGSEAELIALLRSLASSALYSLKGGMSQKAELLIRALSLT